jgi:hypothetical protein
LNDGVIEMLRAISILLAISLGSSIATAADLCKGGPKSQWKTAEQAKQAAVELGYKNTVKVILEDGCYEVVTLNADGKIVGVQFDPVTLELAKVEEPR